MGGVFRALMNLPLFRSILRPITRIVVGLIAIPLFRFVLRRVFRLQELNHELEKDLEEWFRGALLLLAASANMEHLLFGWMANLNWLDRADWLTLGLRLMLAIGVIEAMPDQELFAVIHPGPPKLTKGRMLKDFWQKKWAIFKGILSQHLNRSSPVLAMMCAIVGSQLPTVTETREQIAREQTVITWSYAQQATSIGPISTVISVGAADVILPDLTREVNAFNRNWERWLVGWVCYLLAITQYLIIGLVTSRDRAMDVLSEFDRAVARRRRELIEEFDLTSQNGQGAAAAASGTPGGSVDVTETTGSAADASQAPALPEGVIPGAPESPGKSQADPPPSEES